MKKHTKGIIAIVTGVVLTTTLAACGFHHKNPEEKAAYIMEKISKELQLTDTQLVQLEQLKNDLLTARQEIADKKNAMRSIADELLSQPILDQQRILNLVQERTEAINQKAPAMVTSLAGFYDSLNTEQQGMLREKIKEYHADDRRWHH